MTTNSRSAAPIAKGDSETTNRKIWRAPRLIESKVWRKTEKYESNFGYEFHETSTTNAS